MNNTFSTLISKLTKEEKSILKNNLASQIESFFDDGNNLKLGDSIIEGKFNLLAETLRILTPNNERMSSNGIAFRGFPKWVTTELLENLQNEAVDRRNKPLDRFDHFLGCGGKEADLLSISKEVEQFVSNYVGKVESTGIASYLYYDRVGDGIRPHIDTEVFSINLILMLKHKFDPKLNKKSATVVFPAYQPAEKYYLDVGEVLIMFGSSVIHTRTIINADEEVHLLTIGYKLVN